jgi:phospho-N-acetylmuramoyl-pentapeptide-transferase
MIYHLLYPLHTTFAAFNVFRYITFRTIYASLTAFLICFLLGPWVIRRLSMMQVGQYIREDGPKDHAKKAGTPTMGGVLIIFAVAGSTLLWTDLTNRFVWIALLATLGFGAIGFADDYLMQVKKRSLGLTARQKLLLQILLALLVGLLAYMVPEFSTKLSVPFFKRLTPDPGWGYIFFAALVIVGACNAVNLTDGLDGLAIGPVIIAAVTYMIFAYVAGHARIADYLQIAPVAGVRGDHGILRGAGRRRLGILVVQRISSAGVYGGCRFAVHGGVVGHRCRDYQAGDPVGAGRWPVCHRGPLRNLSGGIFQDNQGPPNFPDGAYPPPF